jgi:hypothetical protein
MKRANSEPPRVPRASDHPSSLFIRGIALAGASILDQTTEFAIDNMVALGRLTMNEVSVYTVEHNAWSIARRCEMHFRLTYERGFDPFACESRLGNCDTPAASSSSRHHRKKAVSRRWEKFRQG